MFVHMWSRPICSVVNTCSLDATIWNCAWVLCLNVLIWPIAKVRGFVVHNHKTCDIMFFQKLIALHHQQAQCWIMSQKFSLNRFCHRRLVILFHLFDQMTPSKMADEISWEFTALRVLSNPQRAIFRRNLFSWKTRTYLYYSVNNMGADLRRKQARHQQPWYWPALIARFMGPAWGPSGADRTQMGPMLAPWTTAIWVVKPE